MDSSEMTTGNFSAMKRLLVFAKPAGAVTSVVAATISFATLLSLVHEIAFYSAINFGFLALLATTDYVKQSIYWAPFIVVGLIPGNILGEKSNSNFAIRKATAIAEVDHDTLMALGFKSRIQFISITIFLVTILAIFSILLPWPILFLAVPFMLIIIGLSLYRKKFQNLPRNLFKYSSTLVTALMVSAILGYCEAAIKTAKSEA